MKTAKALHLRILSFSLPLFLSNGFIYAQKNEIRVSIIQNGKEIMIKGDTVIQNITLKKDEFRLLFNSFAYTDNKGYVTRVDAFTDKKGAVMIHPGTKIQDISYFSDGTGIACKQDKEYECLYIDQDFSGHHYIMYEEKDRRAKLEGKTGDTLRLSWTIQKISLDRNKEIAVKKVTMNDLYLVVLNDFNLNGIVDKGEYSVIHISFK